MICVNAEVCVWNAGDGWREVFDLDMSMNVSSNAIRTIRAIDEAALGHLLSEGGHSCEWRLWMFFPHGRVVAFGLINAIALFVPSSVFCFCLASLAPFLLGDWTCFALESWGHAGCSVAGGRG